MTHSMYQASVPAVIQILNSFSAILDKTAAHCEARKIDPAVLLASRLYPDMFPLSRQIQIVTDHAKGMAARLAGLEVPIYDDKETSLAELKDRIARTIAFVKGVAPAQIDGSEERAISLKAGPRELHFKGQPYLVHFALPNFYFHATVAYAILRHNGVEIGKKDYLGPM
ncbi:MAG: DUF1993 domain-containing protein [Rhodospirillales bacterium]|nr:DUF1993 domain-containing protein [Rhodospirillales bacterium]